MEYLYLLEAAGALVVVQILAHRYGVCQSPFDVFHIVDVALDRHLHGEVVYDADACTEPEIVPSVFNADAVFVEEIAAQGLVHVV